MEEMCTEKSLPIVQVLKTHVVPSLSIGTRIVKEFKFFVDFSYKDNSSIPVRRKDIKDNEDHYALELYNYIIKHEQFKHMKKERYTDWIKLFDAKMTTAIHIIFGYGGRVPDIALLDAHFRACAEFYPDLEALVIFWHNVMTEVWTDGNTRRLFEPYFMPIEKSALLVIYFLQQCLLILLIVRDTDVFLQDTATWDQVYKWIDGEPFFTEEYIRESKAAISKSPFSKLSNGQMFQAMLHFYAITVPFGRVEIDFHQGAVIDRTITTKQHGHMPIHSIPWWNMLDGWNHRGETYFNVLLELYRFLSIEAHEKKIGCLLVSKRFQIVASNKETFVFTDNEENPTTGRAKTEVAGEEASNAGSADNV